MERLRTGAASPLIGIALLALAVGAVAGCGLEQRNGYVQSPNGNLSFRHPSGWEAVDLSPEGTEWVTALDAGPTPDSANVRNFVLDDPFVVAQVFDLDPGLRQGVSLAWLRTLALTDRRDPISGQHDDIRLVFHEPYLDDRGFEGHHMRIEVDFPEGTAVEEHFAVFNTDRTRLHRVRLACSVDCFTANTDEIESLFDSVALQP